MTTLTWRDVAAPDFRGVQEGFRNFSDLLGTAFDSAQKGLQAFDNSRSDAVNAALMARIAGAQDPEAAKAIGADLTSSFKPADLSRLNATSWKALMSRPDDLITRASSESELDFNNYTRNLAKTDRAAWDTAAPHIAALAAARDTNDPAKIAAAWKEHGSYVDKLPGEKILGILSDLQGLESGAVGIAGNRQNQSQSATRFENEQFDRQLDQYSDIAAGELRQSGIDAQSWNQNFGAFREHLTQKYGPVAGALIAEKARRSVFNDPTAPSTIGGADGGSLGGGTAGDPLTISNYEARAAGINGIPDSVQNLGQWSNWASDVNSRGVSSSAAGLFQITGETLRDFAPKVFGTGWQNVTFTPQAQDKIAAAIFADARSKPNPVAALRGRWSALKNMSDGQVAQLARMPWEQAREHITPGESGARNVQALLGSYAQDRSGQVGPQYNRSQDPAQTFAEKAVPLMNDRSSAPEVAARLTAKDGGVLAGQNVGDVTAKIFKVAEDYKISPALAGLVLTESIDGNKGAITRAWAHGIFGDGLDTSFSKTKLDNLAKLAKNPNALIAKVKEAGANNDVTQLVASASQADAAAQSRARQRAALAAQTGRGYNPSFDLANAASAGELHGDTLVESGRLTQAGQRQDGSSTRTNQRNVPEAPQAAPKPAPANKSNSPADVTALINRHLTTARGLRGRAKDLEKKGFDTPFNKMRLSGDIRREQNKALELAMTLPRFARKNGEHFMAWRERVRKEMRLGDGL